jgi:hypothetical protein
MKVSAMRMPLLQAAERELPQRRDVMKNEYAAIHGWMDGSEDVNIYDARHATQPHGPNAAAYMGP